MDHPRAADIQTMLNAGDRHLAPERAGRQLWRGVAPALDAADEEPQDNTQPTELWEGADDGVDAMTTE